MPTPMLHIAVAKKVNEKLSMIFDGKRFSTINEVFAFVLSQKLGDTYGFTEEQMTKILEEKPSSPNEFNYYMDHAYFSATVLFKKLFVEMDLEMDGSYLDSLTAILMHNSLYKSHQQLPLQSRYTRL